MRLVSEAITMWFVEATSTKKTCLNESQIKNWRGCVRERERGWDGHRLRKKWRGEKITKKRETRMKKKKRSVRDGGEREKNWQEACTAVSGCSEEYRLWHPLVVLHTLCLIKHTSNTLADFLPRGVWGGERAHSFSCVCVCARVCVLVHACVFAEESVIDVLFI